MINKTNLVLLGGAVAISLYIITTSSTTDEIQSDNTIIENRADNVNYIKEVKIENQRDDEIVTEEKKDNSNSDTASEYTPVRDDQYIEKQQELKDKIFNQDVQPVINSNGYPLSIMSKDKTKVATIYSNAIAYDPRNSTIPPPAPSIISFRGITAVVPSETINENVETVAAITDQSTGETEYIDLNEPAKPSEEYETSDQSNTNDQNSKSEEPIVITTPPSPGQ